MAKLKFDKEWRLWISVGAVFAAVVLYLYVASRPPTEGGENLWRVIKVLDSRQVSLKGSGNVVNFKLAGLKIPEEQEEQIREFLSKNLDTQWVRIKVLKEGPGDVREGLLYLSGEDINARLVRHGMAEIDREEQGFDVRPYIELEQEAKREKKGLWRDR
jgi:endonuclease YncB( thermonuclease family)